MVIGVILHLMSILALMTGHDIEHVLETISIGTEAGPGDRRSGYSTDGGTELSSDSVYSCPTNNKRKKRTWTGSSESSETIPPTYFRDAIEERPAEPTAIDQVEVTRMRPPLAHEKKEER